MCVCVYSGEVYECAYICVYVRRAFRFLITVNITCEVRKLYMYVHMYLKKDGGVRR